VPNRVLVATTDGRLREAAAAIFAGLGCEVATADGGADCLGQLRASPPDLVVLVPPLPWGSVAGVLAAAHEDSAGPRVPVLILPPGSDGPFPHVPRLFAPGRPDGAALGPLVDRACAWARSSLVAQVP
jgi:hypothetical protein